MQQTRNFAVHTKETSHTLYLPLCNYLCTVRNLCLKSFWRNAYGVVNVEFALLCRLKHPLSPSVKVLETPATLMIMRKNPFTYLLLRNVQRNLLISEQKST